MLVLSAWGSCRYVRVLICVLLCDLIGGGAMVSDVHLLPHLLQSCAIIGAVCHRWASRHLRPSTPCICNHDAQSRELEKWKVSSDSAFFVR